MDLVSHYGTMWHEVANWANFSLSQLYSHGDTYWANLYISGQPNTFSLQVELALQARDFLTDLDDSGAPNRL